MCAATDDATVLDVDDVVGQDDRGSPVRHDDHSRRQIGFAQAGQDASLDLRVDSARRVIHDQQPWATHERAGQCQPLSLPAGESGTTFADDRVETVGQRPHEPVRLREA